MAEMNLPSATMKKHRTDSFLTANCFGGDGGGVAHILCQRNPSRPSAGCCQHRLDNKDVHLPAVGSCMGADLHRIYEPSAQDLSCAEVEQHCDHVYDICDLNDKH